MMADLELLRRLCSLRGVSGREEEVSDAIRKEVSPYADQVETDALGNLIVRQKGRKRAPVRLMLSAHMDEVGLIVTSVTEDGLLKFSCVGGIDRRVLPGKSVLVEGEIPGVIGVKPIHLLEKEELGKAVPPDDLTIDIGARDHDEALKHVSPGDVAAFDSGFDCSRGVVTGRALDDRAGCAILIDLLKREPEYDRTVVFCVQEEIGLCGSATAAYSVNPQAAVVVEATTAADVADVEKMKQVCRVGGGPVVSFMDRRTIYDREYYRLAFRTAQENGIPCQAKQAVAGGNDAGSIHASRSGVRTAAVSLACRYLHSAAGLISEEDFHNTEKLVEILADRIAGAEPCP